MQTQTLLRQTDFSVGICALTEVETTLQIVGQILTMDDRDLQLREIIVATPNRNLAVTLEGIDKRLIVILEDRREGKANAVRKILKRATGDILVLVSADVRLGRYSLLRLVHALAGDKVLGAVDSNVELVNGESGLVDRVSNLLWELHNELLERLNADKTLGHVAGDLIAMRRDLIEDMPNVINDDAYIGLTIKRKGYAISRIQNAPVWIAGPRNPADYVSQRSRVLRGHLQLVSLLGTIPTTFEFTLLSRPIRNLGVLTQVVRRLGARYIPALLTALLLELVSFEKAVFQHAMHRKNSPWRIVRSTKRV